MLWAEGAGILLVLRGLIHTSPSAEQICPQIHPLHTMRTAGRFQFGVFTTVSPTGQKPL